MFIKNVSLKLKIIFSIVLILAVTLGSNNWINNSYFINQYKIALENKTIAVGNALNLQLKNLLSFDIPLTELVNFDEQCKKTLENDKELSAVMVVDYNGNIIFHSSPDKKGSHISDKKLIKSIRQNKTNVYSDLSEKDFDIVIPVLDQNNIQIGAIILELPTSSVNSKLVEVLIHSVATNAIFFLTIVLLLYLILTQFFTKPISDLLKTITEIRESGDLNRTVKVKTSDEIGKLGEEFNQMILKIKSSYVDLEKKVSERTKELMDSKTQIEASKKQLEENLVKLEKINKLMIGRELKMAEMKKKMEDAGLS